MLQLAAALLLLQETRPAAPAITVVQSWKSNGTIRKVEEYLAKSGAARINEPALGAYGIRVFEWKFLPGRTVQSALEKLCAGTKGCYLLPVTADADSAAFPTNEIRIVLKWPAARDSFTRLAAKYRLQPIPRLSMEVLNTWVCSVPGKPATEMAAIAAKLAAEPGVESAVAGKHSFRTAAFLR